MNDMTMCDLLAQDHGAIRVLTMNRPGKHNALTAELMTALTDALRSADADDSVRVVVLTGAGRSFCSGADISVPGPGADAPDAIARRARSLVDLHSACAQISKPVIAAVRGYALGGGAGLALDCDMVVMAEDARLGYPELKRETVAGVVMANLVRQVGRKKAFELLALGDPIDGPEALALGLVNRVAPSEEVLPVAIALAGRLAAWSPMVMGITKRTFHRACELPLSQALDLGGDVSALMRSLRHAAVERTGGAQLDAVLSKEK